VKAVRAALALLALVLPRPPAADASPGEKPFPVPDRSMILREEKTTYLVEGRVRIPPGVEISCQKDIYIKAKGGPAFLEVAGSLAAHGVDSREIIFEGVTVVPAETFGQLQLDSCIFRKGGGLATDEGKSAAGDLVVQLCNFTDGARIALALHGGSVQLLDGGVSGVTRLRGVDREGKPNRVKATLRGFDTYGLLAEGLADITVRLCRIVTDPLVLKDNAVLIFDGNKVEAKEASFVQSRAGGFAKTQVMKCDLYSKRISFRAPRSPDRADAVVLDKCWFEGETKREAIAERIRDAADDPACGVRVGVQNPLERPLELAGAVNR